MTLLDDNLTDNYVKASYLQRFGASFVDGLVLLIPNMVVQFALGDGIISFLIQAILYILYGTYLESGTGQATFGKRALNLQVVRDGNGTLDFSTAFQRNLLKYISWILFFLTLPYIFLISDERRTPYDTVAGTRVVRSDVA